MVASTASSPSTIRRTLMPLLLVVALLIGAFSKPALAASTETRVLPQLQAEAVSRPNDDFRVIVTRQKADASADEKLQKLGGAKIKEVKAEAFVAYIKGSKIVELGKDPGVKYVSHDAQMLKSSTIDSSKLATLYPQVVKASGLWSGSNPITGAGVGVAILDTGVQNSLSDWKDANGYSRVIAQTIFNSNTKNMSDGHGHGTHVAGIIAGNSWKNYYSTVQGKYIGIAPEAKIINVKVSDDTGMSYVSDVVNAIDWVITNRAAYNIRVMNLSLVSSVAESATTSTLAAAVERAWFNGIFVVVSSGNAGANTMHYPPANDPFVMTVGASDAMNTVATNDDLMAPWSSYGTTQDGRIKPEVVAPGRYIAATLSSSGGTLAKAYPDRIVDSNYIWLSGTSMAAPIVSGIAALAFQAHPEWTNDQVKWLLINTATKLGTTTTSDSLIDGSSTTSGFTPLPGQGAGEVNAEAVVRYAGTPGYANQGLVINQQLSTTSGATAYDSASWNTASWNTASWNTASWNTASWNTASWNTNNFSTASWNAVIETDQP